jgi:pimeloyl-ACP methyl ester carboxylesterase
MPVADRITLNTLSWGAGSRRILLLHGIGSNAAGWWRVGGDLAGAGWRVTAADLRGHGSSPSARRYRLDDHAEDVLGLGDGWDAVLGHSMGGAIAVLAQSRHPGFAGRLVLQDPAIVMAEPKEEMIRWLVEVYDRPLSVEQVAADNPRWHRRDVEAKVAALRRAGPDTIVRTVEDSWPWNVLAELEGVGVPTVIIGSDPRAGGIFPVALGRWLESANRDIVYRFVRGSGHSAHRYDDAYGRYREALIEALHGPPTLRGASEEEQ